MTIDYRIYNPESDEKSQIEHVEEMMIDVVKKKMQTSKNSING